MSELTNNTDFDIDIHNNLYDQYKNSILKQIPLPLEFPSDEQENENKQEQILMKKIKWVIEYFARAIKYKSKLKGMLNPVLSLSHDAKNKEKIIKNVCNLRIMLKHCDINQSYELFAETVLMAMFQKEST